MADVENISGLVDKAIESFPNILVIKNKIVELISQNLFLSVTCHRLIY